MYRNGLKFYQRLNGSMLIVSPLLSINKGLTEIDLRTKLKTLGSVVWSWNDSRFHYWMVEPSNVSYSRLNPLEAVENGATQVRVALRDLRTGGVDLIKGSMQWAKIIGEKVVPQRVSIHAACETVVIQLCVAEFARRLFFRGNMRTTPGKHNNQPAA